MAGVKIEQGTLTHRKTLRLKGLLGIGVAQAVGHLTMLWVWAANNAKNGSLVGLTPTEIAEVSGSYCHNHYEKSDKENYRL